MGQLREATPACLLVAVVSRYDEALTWALVRSHEAFGPIALTSPAFDFTETDYYTSTMGPDLKKQFLAFARPIDPGDLAGIKRQTNKWEVEYAALGQHVEPRPLNLDPGYITPAKLVLASTKDHAHRIFLGQGIYAEVTLSYRHGDWHSQDWTYPDYQRADYHRFFGDCRRLAIEMQNR